MTSVTGFFQSSDSTTSSSITGLEGLPPIGTHYGFTEYSSPNHTVSNHAVATKMLENINRVYFYYSRIGDGDMCRFRVQYNDMDGEWRDKITFLEGENLTSDWVLLDIDFSDVICKGVRFIWDLASGYKSDMGISDINFEYING